VGLVIHKWFLQERLSLLSLKRHDDVSLKFHSALNRYLLYEDIFDNIACFNLIFCPFSFLRDLKFFYAIILFYFDEGKYKSKKYKKFTKVVWTLYGSVPRITNACANDYRIRRLSNNKAIESNLKFGTRAPRKGHLGPSSRARLRAASQGGNAESTNMPSTLAVGAWNRAIPCD